MKPTGIEPTTIQIGAYSNLLLKKHLSICIVQVP